MALTTFVFNEIPELFEHARLRSNVESSLSLIYGWITVLFLKIVIT